MNGSKENRAHGASEKPGRRGLVLDLTTAHNMLPLVERVSRDIVEDQGRLAVLVPEAQQLERQRRDLSWPERARRYQLQEELSATEKHLQETMAELTALGLVLINAKEGLVGFPTVVNGRSALLSWKRGEDKIGFWQDAGELQRRPIPASWGKADKSASRK